MRTPRPHIRPRQDAVEKLHALSRPHRQMDRSFFRAL